MWSSAVFGRFAELRQSTDPRRPPKLAGHDDEACSPGRVAGGPELLQLLRLDDDERPPARL
jgi:hypothetical protein